MRRRALLAVFTAMGLSAACGSKTGLLLPGQGGSGNGPSGGGGGSTPLAVTCNAALQAGAPTPTQGFCTTRANQGPVAGPHAPAVAWAVTPFPILSPEDYLPAETVVDAGGRAYVAINASPLAPMGTANQLFAVNDDGSVAWMTTLGPTTGAVQLSMGRDGHLWFLEGSVGTGGSCATPCGATLTALSSEGATVATLTPSVPSFSLMAIASDGSFFVGGNEVARVAADGEVLWQAYADFGASLVVGPADDVIGSLYVYDAAGGDLGPGPFADVTAVNAQGNIVGLSVEDTAGPALVVADPDGDAVLSVTLASTLLNIDAYRLAVAGDGTILVLLADEATAPGLTKSRLELTAIDTSGKTRWTTPLEVTLPYDPADLATHYGLFVDAAGTVVVTAGAVMGLDLASGSVLWTLQPPKPQSCLRPAVLGTGGSILATQCDGTVFLARDP